MYHLLLKPLNMATYKVEEIEGIGPDHGEKFMAKGNNTVDKSLEKAPTKKQRQSLAEETGISEKLVLKVTNMADLFRISGVGQENAELPEAAGVDTVPELAKRNGANVTAKLEEVNAVKNLARKTPTVSEVEKWIAQANALPRVMEY
jgi:predicted flap endonuclease-1-like 5' DNA nuclease